MAMPIPFQLARIRKGEIFAREIIFLNNRTTEISRLSRKKQGEKL